MDNQSGIKWISVKDRLPKDTGKIQVFLVCRAQKSASFGNVLIETAYFTDKFAGKDNITHWANINPPEHQSLMDNKRKQDIINFFSKNPRAFGRFCTKLLEGDRIYWCDYLLTDAETTEIYQAMRKVFPGRKE